MQLADKPYLFLSQNENDFSGLQVAFITQDKKNIFSLVKDLNCQFITQVNFQYTLEISRFKKIDAICLDMRSYAEGCLQFLKDYASDNTLNPTPIIALFEKSSAILETLLKNKQINDYYIGPFFHSTLFTLRFKNFLQLYCNKPLETQTEKVELAFMAFYDKLTNLPNRQLFQERVEEKIRQESYLSHNFSILFLDLDGFKLINDHNGHQTGDWLLNQVGVRLRNCLKKIDTVARLGGDEFAVLINEVKDKETIGKIAHRILNRLSTPYIYYGEYLKIRASIGISLFPQDGKTYQSLITQADQAMYLSKKNGKSQYYFAS